MCNGALGCGGPQSGDSREPGPGAGIVQSVQRLLGDVIEIGVVTPKQLDKQRLFGREMVVQAAGLNAGGVGDVVHRGTQSRSGDQRRRDLQDFSAPGSIVCRPSRRHRRTLHNIDTPTDSRLPNGTTELTFG